MRRSTVWAVMGLTAGIYAGSAGGGAAAALSLLFLCLSVVLIACTKNKGRVLCLVVCAVIGFGLITLNLGLYHKNDVNGREVQVCGILTDSEGVLRDCEIDGKKVKGKIRIDTVYTVKNNKKLYTGSKIRFDCELKDCFVDKDGMYTAEYKQGVRYYTDKILSEAELVEETSPHIDESVRLYVKDILSSYLDRETFGIAYAMLVGDKSEMGSAEAEVFRNTGIAHIFAVSGLHVGFVVMIVNAFVKRRKKLGFVITMLAVLFYAYICGFSPSILRAMLMTGILLGVKALGREPDFLSSVCFAAFVIMAIKPLYLFDAGFRMSVGAMLGIDFITKTLERLYADKNRYVKKLLSGFAVSLGASLGTAPFILQYFGKLSVIGVLFNVIAIPLVSLVFTLLLLALLVPILFFVFPLVNAALNGITTAATYFAEIPMLSLPPMNMGIIPYYVLLYTVSGHNMYTKLPMTAMSVLLVITLTFYSNLPVYTDRIEYYQTEGSTFCVYTQEKEKYIFTDLYGWQDYIHTSEHISADTTLYITDYDKINTDYITLLADKSKLKLKVLSKITNDKKYYYMRSKGIEIERVRQEDNGKVKITTIEYIDKTLAIRVKVGNNSFAYIPYLTEFQERYVLENLPHCDGYYAENIYYRLKSARLNAIVATADPVSTTDIYTCYSAGDFTLRLFSDKMLFVK